MIPAGTKKLIKKALEEDLIPLGDIGSSLIDEHLLARANVVIKSAGVVAGLFCVTQTYKQLSQEITYKFFCKEGDEVVPGSVCIELEGPLALILAGERTALNFLGHLCGVATFTNAFVKKVKAINPKVEILDTRKTLPGLRALQKYAVRMGGAKNHRGNLSEAIMIKDNYLAVEDMPSLVKKARELWPMRTVEVECDTIEQVKLACSIGVDVIMCDNMSYDEIVEAVKIVRRQSTQIAVEVSGG
ncbi:MAG: carboxylating nicotinate-nucleotide diphosphorylase, partial [Nitrososphaerota archaeon]